MWLLEGLRLGAAMSFEVLGGGYLPREGDARASAGEPHLHYLVSTLSGHFSSTSGTLVSLRLVECREAWSKVEGMPECFAVPSCLCVCHQSDEVGLCLTCSRAFDNGVLCVEVA